MWRRRRLRVMRRRIKNAMTPAMISQGSYGWISAFSVGSIYFLFLLCLAFRFCPVQDNCRHSGALRQLLIVPSLLSYGAISSSSVGGELFSIRECLAVLRS